MDGNISEETKKRSGAFLLKLSAVSRSKWATSRSGNKDTLPSIRVRDRDRDRVRVRDMVRVRDRDRVRVRKLASGRSDSTSPASG